jgi:hypothetical protein
MHTNSCYLCCLPFNHPLPLFIFLATLNKYSEWRTSDLVLGRMLSDTHPVDACSQVACLMTHEQ